MDVLDLLAILAIVYIIAGTLMWMFLEGDTQKAALKWLRGVLVIFITLWVSYEVIIVIATQIVVVFLSGVV